MSIIKASKRFQQKRAVDLLYRELKNAERLRHNQHMLKIVSQLLESFKAQEFKPKND